MSARRKQLEDDRKLADLRSVVFNVIGKPIEDATVRDWELLDSALSPDEIRAVNQYARLTGTAIGSSWKKNSTTAFDDNRGEQLGIRIEPWLKTRLEEVARREERSVAQLVRRILKEFVSSVA
jgi:hypothetical protein